MIRPAPWHDVLGAGALTAPALLSGRRGRRAFAAGVGVGLLWEAPFYALKQRPDPVYTDVQPWPLPPLTQPAVHALWDGGLLLVGRLLAERLAATPAGRLAVATAWGAGQELVAELVGNGRVWQWQERPYNPALFRRGDVAYTLLPQLVWTLAPAVHDGVLRATSWSRSRRRRG